MVAADTEPDAALTVLRALERDEPSDGMAN
jgi:hypothetical protein